MGRTKGCRLCRPTDKFLTSEAKEETQPGVTPPLCSSFFSHASGASARDRGHNAVVIREKGWSHYIWYQPGIRRTRRAGWYQGHPFSLESRGLGGTGAENEVTPGYHLESSDVRGR